MPPKKNISPKKELTITKTYQGMHIPELKKIIAERGIDKSTIKKSEKSAQPKKGDLIRAILDDDARKFTGGSIKIGKVKSPTEIVVKSKGIRVSGLEKMTADKVVENLQKFPAYESLTKYQITKKIGGAKIATVAQLRTELANLRAGGSPSPKKSPKKEKKKKVSPKKEKKEKKKSPKKEKKKKVSPKKSPTTFAGILESLKCENRELFKDKYCNTKTGKFNAKNKNGKPRITKELQALKDEYGDEYEENEKYRLIGRKRDIKAHINHWGEEIEVPTKLPEKIKIKTKVSPKKKKVKVSPKKDYCLSHKKLYELFSDFAKQEKFRASEEDMDFVLKNSKVSKKDEYCFTYAEIYGLFDDLSTNSGAMMLGDELDTFFDKNVEKFKISSKKNVSPKKISPKKISPKKISPKKKSKKLKPSKTGEKHKKCASSKMKKLGNYTKCDPNKVCDVFTGNCVEDTEENKKGKVSLNVDGQVIIGDTETIEKLKTVLGGTITKFKKGEEITQKSGYPRKLKSPKKSPKKVVEKKTELPKKQKSPEKTENIETEKFRKKIADTFIACLKEQGVS